MTDLNPCIVCGPPVSATMFKHQRDAYELALSVFGYNTGMEPGGGAGLLFEMGCGKTLTALAIAGRLYLDGHIDRLLIVAPTSVCAVWPEGWIGAKRRRRRFLGCSMR